MSMTIAGSIVALAKKYGASGSATASTINEALDLLNDTLAGSDADAETTIALAIDAVANGIVPSGTITITENGEGIDVAAYDKATVNVPNPSTGTLTITENGEGIDVTQYAYVTVAVTAASNAS